MANLKQLKQRIAVVNSTKKITSAMKMVAAAKLRRSQDALNMTEPYANGMRYLVKKLIKNVKIHDPNGHDIPKVISGNGSDKKHLLLIISSDKGLCGGFNSTIVRLTKRTIKELTDAGKEVKLMFVGRKAKDSLFSEFGHLELKNTSDVKIDTNPSEQSSSKLAFLDDAVGTKIELLFEKGIFDNCSVIYNKFVSTVSQKTIVQKIIPLDLHDEGDDELVHKMAKNEADYDYEPAEKEILERLLPDYMQNFVSRIILESFVSEYAARMTSMDAATRNAKDMIDRLNLMYNRNRQSLITTELTEIISGAEAL